MNEMEITIKHEEDSLYLAPSGRLDGNSAPKLEEAFKSSVGECRHLVVDLGAVEYISSAGLRVLLYAQKVMTKRDGMRVRNVKGEVRDVFDASGFSDIFAIEESEDE